MTNGRSTTSTTLWRSGAFVAVAMGIMNVGTYGFQIIAARALGPSEYGAVASLMAVLIVVAVLQLGLQATAARRIAGQPGHVAQIEREILRVTYRAALALGALMLVLSPVVWQVLRLDGLAPAIVLAIAAVPVTIMGGQAGILQGERRWQPLGLLYLGVGIPRVVIGTLCVAISPTETGALVGVAIAMWVPVAIGWWALRAHRDPGETSEEHRIRPIAAEAVTASLALLAFFLLSNIDIIVARNTLDEHDAGLYAGGLILTKAVLFLPQFVVVIAFPAMSTASERRKALVRSLALIAALGAVCIAGAWLLSDLALVFVGGDEYVEVESELWLFAVLGTVLAMLQLLVYSVLARRGTRSTYLVWAAVVVMVLATLTASSIDGLLVTVIAVDTALLVVLTAISFWRLREPIPEPEAQVPLAG